MKKVFLLFALVFATSVLAKNFYVRTNSDATSWSNITLTQNVDELVTLNSGDTLRALLSVGADTTVYFAPGTYNLPSTLQIKTGKVYGGFSGLETSIDLNARATNDKDGNGIVEPWEFTNEAIFTTANSNYKFTAAGNSSGSRLFTISGTGGELNGVTITDYNFLTYSGPICLGVPATTGTAANNISGKEGILRFCTVKKIKSAIGIVMSTNKYSIIDRCLVESNISSTLGNWGGAVYLNSCGGKVTSCMIRNNAAIASAGRSAGIHATSLASTDMDAIVENCIVYNNYAGANGGAIRGEAQAGKRGIQIVNSTIVNNTTAASAGASVELINSGAIVNSIVVNNALTELGTEIRANAANSYIYKTIYGDSTYTTGGVKSETIKSKITSNLGFIRPTLSSGVAIPGYTTPWDAAAVAKYDSIRHANFTIANSSSQALLIAGATSLPASYTTTGATVYTVSISATVPTTDVLGFVRPVAGHLDLGAYQFSGVTTAIKNTLGGIMNSRIIAINGGVNIINSVGQKASVFTTTGQLVKSIIVNSDNASIKLNSGLYVVCVGAARTKVMIK